MNTPRADERDGRLKRELRKMSDYFLSREPTPLVVLYDVLYTNTSPRNESSGFPLAVVSDFDVIGYNWIHPGILP